MNVQKTQQILTGLGYQPGPADGIFGSKTGAALKNYQEDNNLPKTGKIDKATAKALGVKISTPQKKGVTYDRIMVRDGGIVMKDIIDSFEGEGWVAGTVEKVDKDSITVHVENGKTKEYRALIDGKTSACIDKKIVQDVSKAVQSLRVGHRVSVAFRKGTDIAIMVVDQSYELGGKPTKALLSFTTNGKSMPRCD